MATLPAGLLLGGSAGAAALLRRLDVPAAPVEAAARRLAAPLLAVLVGGALPLALIETLWQTGAPLDLGLLTDLLPYLLTHTLFGVVWVAQVVLLGGLAWRLRAGHAPGLPGSLAVLAAWPQIGHLAPNYAVGMPGTWLEWGGLAAHRAGAALWPGALAVLLAWSRPGGPAGRAWFAAFPRLALPGAVLLVLGALETLGEHGGWAAAGGPPPFALLVQLKIALLAGLVALGARHFRVYRRPPTPGPAGTLAAEVALAATAALLGALLGALPTPGA